MIGGGDFANNRIIPDCIRAASKGQPIIVRNPDGIRPYQHVLEPLFAYLMIAHMQCENRACAGWYNVGPNEDDCVTNGKLVELFCRKWGNDQAWETQMEASALHEANILKLDCSKLKKVFSWQPRWTIEEAVEKTVEWTRVWLSNGDIPSEMRRQIDAYGDSE